MATHTGRVPSWFQLYVWGDRAKGSGRAGPGRRISRPAGHGRRVPPFQARAAGGRDAAVAEPHAPDAHGGRPAVNGSDDPREQDLSRLFDATVSWDDIEWIRNTWHGPLALKGVVSPADARRAGDLGVDAVVVSNHGGRQLDHVPACINVLPGIVDAVGDRVEVLVDSGIRRGTDIVAALALEARGVLIGRAYLYGLAAACEAGVGHAIDILADEFRTAMALTGARALKDVDGAYVRRRVGQ